MKNINQLVEEARFYDFACYGEDKMEEFRFK